MLQRLTPADNPIRNMWGLGYRSLVSVLPPDAEVSEHTTLHKRMLAGEDPRGKAPGRRRRDGKWSGYDFTKADPTEEDLDAWAAWGAGCGIRCGDGLVAVDIDTTDKAAARTIYELAQDILGPANVRFGDKPKALLLYATEPGETIPYRKVRFSTATEDKAHVELVTAGKQFVACGTHPRTGKPYHWPEGIPARDDLTAITADLMASFLNEVAGSFAGGVTDVTGEAVDRSQVDQETLRGDPDLIRAAMRDMPNSDEAFPSRQSYLAMGYALKAAFGPEHEDEALDLYHQWCGRWDRDGERNDPAIVEEDWRRMKAPYSIGADFIYRHAENLTGWTGRAEAFFTPQEMEGAQEHMPQKVEGYRIESIADLMQRALPDFMVADYLPQDGFGLLYGAPGCGKSFVALDLAMHIAYGLDDWHGQAIKADCRKVLYIAGEGAFGFKARVLAWQEANAEKIKGKAAEIGFLFQPVNFMRPEDIGNLVKAAKALGSDWAFIVIDTVSRAIPGADENLQKDMTVFVHACDAIRTALGGFVLGIHHTSKAGEMRGSSVFSGQADAVFKLSRRKEGHLVVDLFCEKQKDAPDKWTETYQLMQIAVPQDVANAVREVTSLVPKKIATAADNASGAAGGGVIATDAGLQNIYLRAMKAAWDAGEPWSRNKRAGERWGPRVLSRDFGMNADAGAALLDLWEQGGLIRFGTVDSRSKLRGYEVLGFVPEAGSDEADEADDTSGNDDVFG